ncbi:bifunctional diguanylate cyclase/phosphodiesterase [Rhizobiales bacterium]|uniref:putative bifunctional diguanylate cyclase/phosphodiesterase n=1 Tax=Hongsoonwoonella zoysiae TaxID=2821844 RepID=UPI001560104D|nr:bifunctional diguanylate cyclase/phosphodiesterase [Hongsoonwoonella zoysiae]NRG18097.1 bifunctional diguanylate cyclase/phosphodiesterase [Hongsoonwoonella zoysiae]
MNLDRRQNSSRLANAILFPVVGVVLLTVVLAVVLIFWTSRTADRSALENESNLILSGLQLQADLLAKEQESAAVWDAAYFSTRGRSFDPTWLHVNIGQRLFDSYGHDHTLIIGENRSPIYYSRGGTMTVGFGDEEFLAQILPLVARTRARFIIQFARDEFGRDIFMPTRDGRAQSIYETGYAAIEGKPALVSVTAISPKLHGVAGERHAPAVLVSVKVLSGLRLEDFSIMTGIEGLNMHIGGLPHSNETALEIDAPTGIAIGHIAWQPQLPGADILESVTPVLTFLSFAIAILTTAVLIYTRQSTKRLAESESRAKFAALHDGLTGLANRDLLTKRFEELLSEGGGADRLLGVVYIDLDHFKDINDTLGHAAGDEVICEAARRLRVIVPSGALLARISGDEFALLVPDCQDRDELDDLLKRIQDRFASPMYTSNTHLYVSLSIGAAVAPDDGASMGELLRKADIALYSAKANGRGRHTFFTIAMEEQVRARENLARELRRAIDHDQLSLVYQPQTTINGRKILAVEALVRWNHPSRGQISPASFIPLAEETGLINDLGLWVLRRACRDAVRWPHLKLAVNISPIQFRHPQFIERLTSILSATGFNPHRLEIEVTENVFSNEDPLVLQTLQRVQQKGIRVALDDFGSGYSSLSYLRQFPFDTLKIDRAFIAGLETSPHASAILGTIINLGEALGMSVVAEGIETEHQAAFLRLTKCDRLQGYFLSRPVPADEVDEVEIRLGRQEYIHVETRKHA